MTVLFLVVLVDMLGFTIVIPFLTYFVQDLASGQGINDVGSRDFWVGVVIAVYSLAQFLFTPILGSLSDRLGRRPVIMFGLVSNSVFFVVFGLSNSLEMAIIARFLSGAGNGNIAVARAYIGDISTTEMIPRRMGMLGAAFGLGFMIGPFIGGILSDPATGIGGVFDTDFGENMSISYPVFSQVFFRCISQSCLLLVEKRAWIQRRPGARESSLKKLTDTFSNIIGVLKIPSYFHTCTD